MLMNLKSWNLKLNDMKATVPNESFMVNLHLRNNTKNIILDMEAGGIMTDPYGQTKAGFTVNGKINRKEFGLMWNALTEAGRVVVGDEMKIHAEIQLIKQS